ncbi:hypothetical protein ABK040_003210 [Willaertia magna]
MSELDFQIQDKVLEIAQEIGRSPTQAAINWVLHKKGIPSVLIGPRTFEQYLDNMKALEFKLTEEQVKQLDEVSKNSPNIIFPHKMIGNSVQYYIVVLLMYLSKSYLKITTLSLPSPQT